MAGEATAALLKLGITEGVGVPTGYAIFRVRQADTSYSTTFNVKQANGSYRRFVTKVAP